jgi:head-tail adaptor
MRAGPLRQIATIQSRSATADGYNQRSGAWAPLSAALTNVACNINDLSGLELVRAQKIVAECTVLIVMRGFTGWRLVFTPACRAISGDSVNGNRIFDIKSVINPDGRDRELHLLCVEII